MKVVTYQPIMISRTTHAAARLGIADTARRVAEITPVDTGAMRDAVDGRVVSESVDGIRGEVSVNGQPIGKVRMRAYGGEIVPRPGRPLVFYSKRTSSWVTIKHPRTVRQRAGGYSQGWRPWITRAGEIFAESMTARLRQMAAIQPPRNRIRR